jgi:hypothetical protein
MVKRLNFLAAVFRLISRQVVTSSMVVSLKI